MKYFKITDESTGIPIPWKDLPEDIKQELPGDFLWNVKTVDKDGIIEEKTVVYLEEIDDKKEYSMVRQLNEEITIILDYDDIC